MKGFLYLILFINTLNIQGSDIVESASAEAGIVTNTVSRAKWSDGEEEQFAEICNLLSFSSKEDDDLVSYSGGNSNGKRRAIDVKGKPKTKKILRCEYSGCNRVFSKKRDLEYHCDSKHTGVRYSCGYCDKAQLVTMRSIERHFEKKHKGLNISRRKGQRLTLPTDNEKEFKVLSKENCFDDNLESKKPSYFCGYCDKYGPVLSMRTIEQHFKSKHPELGAPRKRGRKVTLPIGSEGGHRVFYKKLSVPTKSITKKLETRLKTHSGRGAGAGAPVVDTLEKLDSLDA